MHLLQKNVIHQIYDVKEGDSTRKQLLPVFIKSVVFHHVGLSCMISINEKYNSQWMNIKKNGVQEGHGLMRKNFRIFVALYLRFFVIAHPDRYDLMCGLNDYKKRKEKYTDSKYYHSVWPLSED